MKQRAEQYQRPAAKELQMGLAAIRGQRDGDGVADSDDDSDSGGEQNTNTLNRKTASVRI